MGLVHGRPADLEHPRSYMGRRAVSGLALEVSTQSGTLVASLVPSCGRPV